MSLKINFTMYAALYITSLVAHGQTAAPHSVPNPEQISIKCIFKITYRPDTTTKAISVEYANLLIGKSLSKFESVGNQATDSIRNLYPPVMTAYNTNPQEYANKILSAPYTKFHYCIYKMATVGKLYCYDKVGPNLYSYSEPDKLFDWKIKQEKATIAGYACQRATTTFAGRVFEAWFTREVPLSEGPYKFYGLPGLIVKINDTNNFYSFELIKLRKATVPGQIALPKDKALFTTKQKLSKGQADYFSSMVNRAPPEGNNRSAAQLQRMKKPTTPLELR